MLTLGSVKKKADGINVTDVLEIALGKPNEHIRVHDLRNENVTTTRHHNTSHQNVTKKRHYKSHQHVIRRGAAPGIKKKKLPRTLIKDKELYRKWIKDKELPRTIDKNKELPRTVG